MPKLSRPPSDQTYYEASSRRNGAVGALTGLVETDVCVVGGGIAGCSAALELATRGYEVVLLEGKTIGFGASGRSGGQVIPGYACDQAKLAEIVGRLDARKLWTLSVESIAVLKDRIRRFGIECDWRDGQLQAATKPSHLADLTRWRETLKGEYGYTTHLVDEAEMRELLATERYCGGLFDPAGGHLHPLNYTLGLAKAAQMSGAQIYEDSTVLELKEGASVNIKTLHGLVRAKFAVVCANTYTGALVPRIRGRIMPVETYVIATEPLDAERARALIRNDCAVMDTNFVLDYFRLSADHRLLFGGRIAYSGHDAFSTVRATRRRMLRVFPQLADVAVDYAWSGFIDITVNRAPDFGRLADNVYYLQGFSGHGIALAGMAGKVVAETIAGQAERFDLFARIPHRNFPGGRALRVPALVLAMLWYRLRDLI